MGNALANHIEAIMKLTKSESLQEGKFKDFTSELIPLVCMSLNASKSSFWLYREGNNEFESIQSFNADTNETTSGESIDPTSYSEFIKHLTNNLFLYVESASDDSSLNEFVMDYLLKNRIRSWVEIQVWNDDRLFGIITAEWKVKKDFSDHDKLLLVTASSMISKCYDSLLRLKEDFLHRNEVSTLKGEEIEKKKLAKKLSDHAFYTSHSIRHPISTILALIDLIKLNWESREAYEELLQQLKIETMNLDDAIRVMTAKIELD